PPLRRPATYEVYKSIIDTHLTTSALALLPLQRLRASDLERYYATLELSPATVRVHHAMLHRALKKAAKERLITLNPAVDLDLPKRATDHTASPRAHCWTAAQARTFLAAAHARGPQVSAFFSLALDTGARKSELYGLAWQHVDFERGLLTI